MSHVCECETFNKMIHGNKSITLPLCIKDFHAPMSIIKKLKMY